MNNSTNIQTCKCGCFVFDAECKKCVKCGAERESTLFKQLTAYTDETPVVASNSSQIDTPKDNVDGESEYKLFDLAVSEYCKEAEQDGFLFGPDKNGCSLEKSNGYNSGFLNGFEKGYLNAQSRIAELEAKNKELTDGISKLIDLNERCSIRYKACFEEESPAGHQVFDLFVSQLKNLQQALNPKTKTDG